MSVLIIGGTGMLGHKLYQRLKLRFEVFATIRSDFESVKRFEIFAKPSIVTGVDVTDAAAIRRAIETVRPDCVVNCVGVVKQNPRLQDRVETLTINSIVPNRLAELSAEFGFRLITISTDCVFDGKKGNYSEIDPPNARDLYGLSKFLGEVTEGNALTIRTSIIGRELARSHSLVEWFLARRDGIVNGYSNAIYSGFPTIELADIIATLISDHPALNGLVHVSSDPISKLELLTLLNEHFAAGISITPDTDVVIDRSLDSAKFRKMTTIEPPRWPDMIARMAADPTPYERLR